MPALGGKNFPGGGGWSWRVWRLDILILGVFVTLFSLQVILSMAGESATFDEPANLASGYVELTQGAYWVFPANLPLVKGLAALPLLFERISVPEMPQLAVSPYLFGHHFMYRNNDGDRLLFRARLALLPIGLILGCVLYLWARRLFGIGAAALALYLYGFDPNTIAHAGLVTTDLAVSCAIFLLFYGVYLLSCAITVPRVLATGFVLACMLLIKFSVYYALPVLPLLGCAAVLSHEPLALRLPGPWTGQVTGRGRKLLVLLLIAIVWAGMVYCLIWGTYRFRYASLTGDWHGLAIPRDWNNVQPENPQLKGLLSSARAGHLLPEAYLNGFFDVLKYPKSQFVFLSGEIRQGSLWYYLGYAFLLKTPLSALILCAVSLFALPRVWGRHRLWLFLFLPAAAYSVGISYSGWNSGLRHLLPIYPFLFLAVSPISYWAIRQKLPIRAGLGAILLWYLVSSLSAFPHYIPYFNELAGGSDNGYKYLVDSNVDWGQDLKGLKKYMDTHGIPRVWLSYFGTASPEYYRIAHNALPSFLAFPEDEPEVLPTPYVAISATNLQGVYLPLIGESADLFESFRQRRPIARIGHSIFLYRTDQ